MVLQITYRIYRCDDNQYELLFKLDLKLKKKTSLLPYQKFMKPYR